MRIYKLTYFAQQLNAALGSGQFGDITYADVWKRIDDGTIFEFLTERLELHIPVSALAPVHRLELLLEWNSLRSCVEPFRFDGHRNGLCLLVGYLLEGIARRCRDSSYRLTLEQYDGAMLGDEVDRIV